MGAEEEEEEERDEKSKQFYESINDFFVYKKTNSYFSNLNLKIFLETNNNNSS